MTKAKTEDKPKPAAKKDEAAAPKEAAASRPQRVTALVNITTTKVIEAQFDTTGKKVEDLDGKLAEIEARFKEKPDHTFATAIRAAREELKVAAEALVTGKDRFHEIRETLEDFFG